MSCDLCHMCRAKHQKSVDFLSMDQLVEEITTFEQGKVCMYVCVCVCVCVCHGFNVINFNTCTCMYM